MAGVLFELREDRVLVILSSDEEIRRLVTQYRVTFRHIKAVAEVYRKIGLLEPDPLVRDRFMALVFVARGSEDRFKRLSRFSDEDLVNVIKDLKDHFSYRLFPMAPEFDIIAQERHGLGFGGALFRSLDHLQRDENNEIETGSLFF